MIFLVMIIACVLGVIVGLNAPMISYTYSSYLAIAIIAALDSVFGGVASVINKKFDMKIFISGFFGNAILAILLTVLGEKLNIDIYLAAIVVFVGRMFNNLGIIRRYYVEKWTENVKNKSEKNKDKNNELTKKQADKIKVNQLQRVDLSQKADGKETLEKRLDLQGYKYIYVVYSEQVKQINSGEKINDTTYTLVGMKEDGIAKVLSDEFEMDSTVGNNASRMQTRINKDGTATRDNKNSSIFVRKSNKMSLSCRNDGGVIRMAMGQKTLEENEITETELETAQTGYIPIETREVFNRNKGRHQIDKVQDEIQEHTDEGCNPKDIEDFDGDEKTGTHEHFQYIEIDENDYIPNTNITWRQFANKCGYRGEGDIEKAVEVVNSLGSVDDKKLEEYIDDQEEEFDDAHQKR